MDPVCDLNVHRQIVSLLDKPDPVIFDIGCNDGSDAQRFLRLLPGAQLYCFEPDPRPVARFKENGFSSGSDEAIRSCDQRPKRNDRVSPQQWKWQR